MELEQNFATCRLLAALINCHWAALLVVVVAVAFAGFNLAHILCKCPTLRGESKEREVGVEGDDTWLLQMQLPRVLTDGNAAGAEIMRPINVTAAAHSPFTFLPLAPLPVLLPLYPAVSRLSCLALALQIVYLNGS